MTNALFDQTTKKLSSKEVKPMTNIDVSFAKQVIGYDRTEVDSYVEDLSRAYQTAYDEYNSVCAKYNDLLEEFDTLLRQQEQTKSNVAVIARTLVDTETLAQKIIADAQAQADKLTAETQAAVQIIRDETFTEKAAVKRQAQKLIDDAAVEVAGMQERAREVVRGAQAEADQINGHARQKLEQTNKSIAGVVERLKELLASEALDPQQTQKQEISVLASFISAAAGE